MLDKLGDEKDFRPHPVLAKALDIMFIVHAEHGMNCSTSALRHVASSKVDLYTAIASAAGALYGPLHGGATESVLRMLEEIGDVKNIPTFLEKVKKKQTKLMGFGHRIYKNYDPRAKILQKVARDVFAVCGENPLMKIALELEKQALSDKYFVERKLYPNVDFYSGIIYQCMGFPTDMFPVLFCIPRIAGWLAHWVEQLDEETEVKIFRPKQMYNGDELKTYTEIDKRESECVKVELDSHVSSMYIRRVKSLQFYKKSSYGK
jgi:citrate synthase